MIRVVPTELGLSLLLGGGWRLVRRWEELESASVLVRGGPGAGKTLFGLQAALDIERLIGGPILVACVEVLPTEYLAQMQSAWPRVAATARILGRADGLAPVPPDAGESVCIGLLDDLPTGEPDLAGALGDLIDRATAEGAAPRVVVVDSLIEGYGMGATTERARVDAVTKFAASRGLALVLCEEATERESQWAFAVDTVVEVGTEPTVSGHRYIEVRKHRFGATVSGRHELDLVTPTGTRVYPQPAAWRSVAARAGLDALDAGRPTLPGAVAPHLTLGAPIRVLDGFKTPPTVEGRLVVVAGGHPAVVAHVIEGLRPGDGGPPGASLLLELDPLGGSVRLPRLSLDHAERVDVTAGPAAALVRWVTAIDLLLREETSTAEKLRRIVVTDLGHILSRGDASTWLEAIRSLSAWVAERCPWLAVIVGVSRGVDVGMVQPVLEALGDTLVTLSAGGTNTLRLTTSGRGSGPRQTVLAAPR